MIRIRPFSLAASIRSGSSFRFNATIVTPCSATLGSRTATHAGEGPDLPPNSLSLSMLPEIAVPGDLPSSRTAGSSTHLVFTGGIRCRPGAGDVRRLLPQNLPKLHCPRQCFRYPLPWATPRTEDLYHRKHMRL